jgi:VWFA-related protein
MRAGAIATAVLMALVLSGPVRPLAGAQDDEAHSPIYSSTTSLVVLHVTATDRHHAYVSHLGREAFRVFDDGREQPIAFFTSEDAPVTVGLVIDSSVSMWSIRELLVAGAMDFAEASNTGDEIFALAFNEHVRAALPPDEPFTSDPVVLREALTRAVAPVGRTALFDALDAGLTYVARGHHERKVLVVLSDGGDNASATSLDDVRARSQASNVVIYAVALSDRTDPDANPKVLRALAEASGGRMFEPRTASALEDAMKMVADDIRHAYTLGFVPGSADGAFHRLRVTDSGPRMDDVRVRTRTGYLAVAPPEGA